MDADVRQLGSQKDAYAHMRACLDELEKLTHLFERAIATCEHARAVWHACAVLLIGSCGATCLGLDPCNTCASAFNRASRCISTPRQECPCMVTHARERARWHMHMIVAINKRESVVQSSSADAVHRARQHEKFRR